MIDQARIDTAWRVHEARDIDLPPLALWNYDPCGDHTELQIACEDCGVEFRRHQRIGISWLYFVENGLLADSVGTGKTINALGLAALLAEKGALGRGVRAVVVCRAPAVGQWLAQTNRLVPSLLTITGTGTPTERRAKYRDDWDLCVVSYQTLLNDLEHVLGNDLGLVVVDDVDPLRNHKNKTAQAINRLAERSPRTVVMTGSPLQKRLEEMHSVLLPVGGSAVLGKRTAFMKRYVKTEKRTQRVQEPGRSRSRDLENL